MKAEPTGFAFGCGESEKEESSDSKVFGLSNGVNDGSIY